MKTTITSLLFFVGSSLSFAANPISDTTDNVGSADYVLAQDNTRQHLSNNECLMALDDRDQVIATVAFHDGANGFGQLQQLLDRQPWGDELRSSLQSEIEQLIKEASPFLIVTLTKKQALQLEDHRDLIKWILVQSTTKPCEAAKG